MRHIDNPDKFMHVKGILDAQIEFAGFVQLLLSHLLFNQYVPSSVLFIQIVALLFWWSVWELTLSHGIVPLLLRGASQSYEIKYIMLDQMNRISWSPGQRTDFSAQQNRSEEIERK